MFGFDLMEIVAGLPGLIIAMALHEYAHARVAVAMGDFTPKLTGRLTLNPLAHLDPIGLLMLLVARFGWAKPVMVNPSNFRNRRWGEVFVALAGPGANFAVAFAAMAVLIFLTQVMDLSLSMGVRSVLWLILVYNVNFGIFNLIPLPPLDGSRVLMAFLSPQQQYKLVGLERYSFLILIVLLVTPVLGAILIPLSQFIIRLYAAIWGVVFGVFF